MISPLTMFLLLILVVVFGSGRAASEAVDALALMVLASFGIAMGVCVVLGLGIILLIATVCFGVLQVVRLVVHAGRALKTAALKNDRRT